LPPDGWAAPTVNVGWSVHDTALHLLGNDVGRLDPRSAADSTDEGTSFLALAARIERSNEQWVDATRRIPTALLVELLSFIQPRVDAAFAAVDLESPGVPVAWTGNGPTPYWLDIAREYAERWVHHAQMRLAVGQRPLVDRRWLFPVVDAFMRCLPRAYEPVEAPAGSTITVEVSGDAGGAWHVVRGRKRWHLRLSATAPDATVGIAADAAWRLLSRSGDMEAVLSSIVIDGDRELGRAAARAVAIMTTRL
jgi:hypothetical protein